MADILLTGVPRAGTTLVCTLLNDYANTVALHEPIPPTIFGPTTSKHRATELITGFLEQARSSLLLKGSVVSKQSDGKLPTNPVRSTTESGLRPEAVELGEIVVGKDLTPDFTLVVKHNALFMSLLPELIEPYRVVGLVRNPLNVLCSWLSVDLPVQDGRIPMAERFDGALREKLDSEPKVLERQLMLLDWFYTRLSTLPEVLHYERLIESNAVDLKAIGSGYLTHLRPLQEQNKNSNVPEALLEQLFFELRGRPEIYERFYSTHDLEVQMEKIIS